MLERQARRAIKESPMQNRACGKLNGLKIWMAIFGGHMYYVSKIQKLHHFLCYLARFRHWVYAIKLPGKPKDLGRRQRWEMGGKAH